MPQKSSAFAVGRVRALEQTLLNRAALDRLLAVQSGDELARALTELGWGDVKGVEDVDLAADEQVQKACQLVRECTSEEDVTDCFLLKYDVLNLKTLIKARTLHRMEEAALSPCGTIEPEKLRRCVEDNNYNALPDELRAAMERVERRIAVEMDPLYVDAELDKALYARADRLLRFSKCEAARAYFVQRAEMINLLIALRVAAMGRSSSFAKELFLPGGTLGQEGLMRVADDPSAAYDLIQLRPYAAALKSALASGSLAAVERQMDDYLLSLIRPHKNDAMTILPLIGYLLAREREAAAVRLIKTAKTLKVSDEKLKERLRAMYA